MILRKKNRPFQEFAGHIFFGKITEADVLDFLFLFADTLAGASQSAPSAEDLSEKLAQLSTHLELLQKSDDSLVFEEVHSHLKVSDHLLSLKAQELNFVRGVAFFFIQRNIRSIAFEKGVSPNEIGELIRILTFGGASSGMSNSVPEELKKSGVRHIFITEQISRKSASVLDELLQSFCVPDTAPDDSAPVDSTLDESVRIFPKHEYSTTMPPLPGTDNTMPPIPEACSEVEAIHTIADIVDEAQETPVDRNLDLTEEGNDDDLLDLEEMEPEEHEIEFKRLDTPVRAADDGDMEGMVDLVNLGDESDQLLSDTSYDDNPFPEPDITDKESGDITEENFTEISFLGSEEEGDEPVETEERTTDIDFKEEEVVSSLGSENDFKEISGPEWDQDDKEIITDISNVDLSDMDVCEVNVSDTDISGLDIAEGDNLQQVSSECGIKFIVKVGDHTLDGASVKVRDFEVQSKTTCGQDGAHFDLEPGEYDVEIDHDGFLVKKQIEVKPGQSKVMIDLQSIFE